LNSTTNELTGLFNSIADNRRAEIKKYSGRQKKYTEFTVIKIVTRAQLEK